MLARQYGADHIGLYRTEFPFLLRKSFPSEDEQVNLYTRVLKKAKGRSVTIRTFDVGGDNYLNPTGNNYSNFQSDFAIKYDLTQRGEYKLKVFNKSSYDIIYKDIRTTGFAIIFVKEFDKLSDIKKEKKDQRNR